MNFEGIMLSEISQKKINTVWFHLYVESQKQNKQTNKTKQNKNNWYREENGDCQTMGEWGAGETGEGDQEAQISCYKINKSWWYNVQHGDCRQ